MNSYGYKSRVKNKSSFYAQLHIVNNECVTFERNPTNRVGGVAITRSYGQTDGQTDGQHAP